MLESTTAIDASLTTSQGLLVGIWGWVIPVSRYYSQGLLSRGTSSTSCLTLCSAKLRKSDLCACFLQKVNPESQNEGVRSQGRTEPLGCIVELVTILSPANGPQSCYGPSKKYPLELSLWRIGSDGFHPSKPIPICLRAVPREENSHFWGIAPQAKRDPTRLFLTAERDGECLR